MKLVVHSRPAIETSAPPEEAHVVISITTSADDVAVLPEAPSRVAVLRLVFPDADVAVAGISKDALFGAHHADRVWDFLEAHRDGITCVVLHCDAGMSRSPGVAAAIARVEHGDDTFFFRRYHPNMRVYRTLLESHHARNEQT
ncbi:MAG: hypothetical protein H6720_22390 [Sandaracinus sp.]|nr:hypothetical protein [Sandaracinus sp.]